ncbi:hypothetical protein Pcinc_037528 [Petrolisthes cinctipes]|uniref:Uncharacterized protein n=1 Tax=Petrolisthes cinctipes TaxID=88211 RepID=A0AAE1BWB7_PETCI|nr:hypothetical protein Pcinc_037528 [Petrolisthes cinctipes]
MSCVYPRKRCGAVGAAESKQRCGVQNLLHVFVGVTAVVVVMTGVTSQALAEVPGLANMEIYKTSQRGLALPGPHVNHRPRYDVLLAYEYDYDYEGDNDFISGKGEDNGVPNEPVITTLERPLVSAAVPLSTDLSDYVTLPLRGEFYVDSAEDYSVGVDSEEDTLYRAGFEFEKLYPDVPEQFSTEVYDDDELPVLFGNTGPDADLDDVPQAVVFQSEMKGSGKQVSGIGEPGREDEFEYLEEELESLEEELEQYDFNPVTESNNENMRTTDSIRYETVVPAPFQTTIHDFNEEPSKRNEAHRLSQQPYGSSLSENRRTISTLSSSLGSHRPQSGRSILLDSPRTSRQYPNTEYYNNGRHRSLYGAKHIPTHHFNRPDSAERFHSTSDKYYRASPPGARESRDMQLLHRDSRHYSPVSRNHYPSFKNYHLSGSHQPRATPNKNMPHKHTRVNDRYLTRNQQEGQVLQYSTKRNTTSSPSHSILLPTQQAKAKYLSNPSLVSDKINSRNRDEVLYYTGLQKEIEKSNLLLDAIRDVRTREGKAVKSHQSGTTTTTITPVPLIEDVKEAFGEHPLYNSLPRENESPQSSTKKREISHLSDVDEFSSEKEEYENLYLPVRVKSLELTGIQEVKQHLNTLRPPVAERRPPPPPPPSVSHVTARPHSPRPNSFPPVTTYKPRISAKYPSLKYPSLVRRPPFTQHKSPIVVPGRSRNKPSGGSVSRGGSNVPPVHSINPLKDIKKITKPHVSSPLPFTSTTPFKTSITPYPESVTPASVTPYHRPSPTYSPVKHHSPSPRYPVSTPHVRSHGSDDSRYSSRPTTSARGQRSLSFPSRQSYNYGSKLYTPHYSTSSYPFPTQQPPRFARHLLPTNLYNHRRFVVPSTRSGRTREKRGPDMEATIDTKSSFPKYGYDIDPFFTDFPVFGFFDAEHSKKR